MPTYAFHPLAEEYPLMPEAELAHLVDDMRQHVYDPRFPITLHEGKILDGRNRYRATQQANVEPEYDPFIPLGKEPVEVQALAFVHRSNEHRRHLTPDWLTQHRLERITRIAEARQRGESFRAIANKEKISLTQVQRDAGVAGDPGDGSPEAETDQKPSPKTGAVTGKDGKQYQAHKPRKKTVPSTPAEPKSAEPTLVVPAPPLPQQESPVAPKPPTPLPVATLDEIPDFGPVPCATCNQPAERDLRLCGNCWKEWQDRHYREEPTRCPADHVPVYLPAKLAKDLTRLHGSSQQGCLAAVKDHLQAVRDNSPSY